jgi:hypothetical protein
MKMAACAFTVGSRLRKLQSLRRRIDRSDVKTADTIAKQSVVIQAFAQWNTARFLV